MSAKSIQKKEAEKIDEEIIERTAPHGKIVYEAIYREGEHELDRTNRSLAWSGLAAGLSMGFSFLMEGLLRNYLPQAHWQPLVAKLGYSIGFIIVILGRQQLFTKNTLTVILPLLKIKKIGLLKNVGRLWLIVLVMNMVGAAIFACVMAHSNVCNSGVRDQFSAIGAEDLENTVLTTLLRAIFAGWVIALMIWLLPFAAATHIWIIIFLAYLIGIGGLPHIIAGAIPSLYVVFTGAATFGHWLTNFFLPVVIGNCIGGVAMVGMAAHAEFVKETVH
jgi:formate/nitrite transporter FocA (FNT family)